MELLSKTLGAVQKEAAEARGRLGYPGHKALDQLGAFVGLWGALARTGDASCSVAERRESTPTSRTQETCHCSTMTRTYDLPSCPLESMAVSQMS